MTDAPVPAVPAPVPDDDWAERYVVCEHLMDPKSVPSRQRFESLARFVRDLVARRWGRDAQHARTGQSQARSTTSRWST